MTASPIKIEARDETRATLPEEAATLPKRAMRVAVLGAFPFPYPQGSQVYATDHTRALRGAGVDVSLFTYGSGVGTTPGDLDVVTPPSWLSPRAMRSGPTLAKFPADAALLASFVRAHRERRFDVVLAHNAEAAIIGLAARPITGTPVIYIAHTILHNELAAYAASSWERPLRRLGKEIDRFIAKRVDGIIALCADAEDVLAPHARGPIEIIPPGLDPLRPPDTQQIDAACARHGLVPESYALYCGNLDGYQDLHLLAEAAHRLSSKAPSNLRSIVVATHDASRIPQVIAGLDRLQCVEVKDYSEIRALIAGAQSVVLSRRRRGGFPIKLLSYMEAQKPIVAYERVAPGFEHMHNAWLLGPEAEGSEFAEALCTLALREDLRTSLGRGSRQLLRDVHPWARLAQKTRNFAETIAADYSTRRELKPIQ
jgi:glycosyltransferase involved in cell wall biosynthesis